MYTLGMPASPPSTAEIGRATAWVGAASFVLGILDLITTLACLRWWVSTTDFGLATLATALMPVVDRLAGAGLGASIVRDQLDDHDASSVFWLAVASSLLVLAILVVARGTIGAWFPQPVVATLLVAFAARVVAGSCGMVSGAMMTRALRFRELSLIRIAAGLADTAAKLGVAALAGNGHPELGPWCFAVGPLANTAVTTIALQLRRPWRPRFAFRPAIARRAVRFTFAVSGGELLYYAYSNADYLVVGAWFGDAAVGVYRIAYELVLDVVRLLSMITAEIAFPIFVRVASDARAAGAYLVRFTRQNLIVLAPFLVFVAIEADDLLVLLYPPMPPEAATASRVLCFVGAVRTLGFIVPPLLAALRAERLVFAYNLFAAVIMPIAFVIGAACASGEGFVGVAWAWTAAYPIAFGVLLAMALPLARTSLAAYARALAKIAACAVACALAGLAARWLAPSTPLLRVLAVAAVVATSFVALLARLERITPASLVRGFRSAPPAG